MDRQRGTVKWFSREKGWGFIRLERGDEIFVHHSDIRGEGFVTLEDDEPVEFSVEEMEKGPRARDVRRLRETPGEQRAESPESPEDRERFAGGPRREPAPGRQGDTARRDDRTREADRGRPPDRESDDRAAADQAALQRGPRPLAEQLRERLGRYFPGLGG